MRRTLFVLSLAGLTIFAGASDAFAQRGYGGGSGITPSFSYSVGRGGYYSPYGNYARYGNYGGQRYSPFYQGYGYSYAPSYYYARPSYYYATPTYPINPATYFSEPAPSQFPPAYYTTPAPAQQTMTMTVLVPVADAQVWVENVATTQKGKERLFQSPPLEPNRNFTYTIKARWMENGQAVNRESQVNVQAGQSITVSFREVTGESVPLPRLPDAIPRE
jgi:uncharacterized protein (TIGR03000 family)